MNEWKGLCEPHIEDDGVQTVSDAGAEHITATYDGLPSWHWQLYANKVWARSVDQPATNANRYWLLKGYVQISNLRFLAMVRRCLENKAPKYTWATMLTVLHISAKKLSFSPRACWNSVSNFAKIRRYLAISNNEEDGAIHVGVRLFVCRILKKCSEDWHCAGHIDFVRVWYAALRRN